MLRVAPHVANNGFAFIPADLSYNKLTRDGKKNYSKLLKELNQYLVYYKDVGIGGLNESMLSTEINNKTLFKHLVLSGVVSDIIQTVFTEAKGIRQVETTKGQVVEAMRYACGRNTH